MIMGDYSGFSFASSQIDGDLRIGSKTDESEDATTVNITATADDLNGEDDEDGVTLPTGVQLGQTRAMTVNVTNLTTSTAFLNIWIDFNQNGVLTDPGERVASNITVSGWTWRANRTVNFSVPLSATLGGNWCARAPHLEQQPGIHGKQWARRGGKIM